MIINGELHQTSAEWYGEFIKTHKTRILDPDGWDRTNYSYSFHEELVTEDTFNRRLMFSTCSFFIDDYEDGNVPGKKIIE